MLVAAILSALGAGALVYWLYKSDLDRARHAVTGGSQVVDTAAGPIEYAERGDGFPLLSIHGAGGGFDQGLANVADLAAGDFRVIAPSRFGYLRTPVPSDASAAAQADAHAALLSKLNVDRAVVVGVSAGARSAVELAVRHPRLVAALILLVPGIYSPTSPVSLPSDRGSRFMVSLARAGGDLVWWIMRKLAPDVLIRFVGVPPALLARSPRTERARVMRIVQAIEPLSLRFTGINADGADIPRRLHLESIVAPTLIVSAQDDLFNTAPAAIFAASRIPGAELIVFETGGHLFVGRGAEVRAAVRALLTRAELASPPRTAPANVEETNARGTAP